MSLFISMQISGHSILFILGVVRSDPGFQGLEYGQKGHYCWMEDSDSGTCNSTVRCYSQGQYPCNSDSAVRIRRPLLSEDDLDFVLNLTAVVILT